MIHPIVAAAIVGDNLAIWSLDAPARHHHIMEHMIERGHSTPIKGTQGFVDEKGRFYNREQALVVAVNLKQVDPAKTLDDTELFTEDLW